MGNDEVGKNQVAFMEPKVQVCPGIGAVGWGGVLSSRSQGKGLEKLCEVSGAGQPRDHIGDMPREPM